MALSSRPSSRCQVNLTCSRSRCRAVASTTSALSQPPQRVAQDKPADQAQAPYRQVTVRQCHCDVLARVEIVHQIWCCAFPEAKPMVVGAGAVRMSVPIVPAQTIKQVTSAPRIKFRWMHICSFYCGFSLNLSSDKTLQNIHHVAFALHAGGTKALDINRGREHHPDPATPHHASYSSPPDPAKLHQPSLSRPGTSPQWWERRIHSPASTICHAGLTSLL